MGHRWVKGLISACEGSGPGWGPSRPKGAKAKGLGYERALAAVLPEFRQGVWWRFEDANGPGWCQTDFVLVGRSAVLVLESKLSWCVQGHSQLRALYQPVLTKATGMEVLGVLVTGKLRPDMPAGVVVAGTLQEALDFARTGRPTVLHWLPKTPLARGRVALTKAA